MCIRDSVIVLIIAVLLFGLIKLMQWIGKRNRDEKYREKRDKFSGHLLYGFYVLMHPFDGFYDLKHEKRGSLGAATFWLMAGVSGVVPVSYTHLNNSMPANKVH